MHENLVHVHVHVHHAARTGLHDHGSFCGTFMTTTYGVYTPVPAYTSAWQPRELGVTTYSLLLPLKHLLNYLPSIMLYL